MKKITEILDRVFHVSSAISFGCVSFCVLVQIITRYTPGISAPWTDELTRLFFMYTIMLGAPMTIKYQEYAEIDIVTGSLKGRMSHTVNILVNICIVVFNAVAVKQAFLLFQSGFKAVSTSLQLGMWIFYLVPVGIFTLTCVYSLGIICIEFNKMRKGEI